jgi:tetratricopeptide (TPR) repeat protein
MLEQGFALVANGDPDEALAAFDAAIEREPGHAGAWFAKGELLQGRGDEAGASACFERVTVLRPDYAEGWYRSGVALVNEHKLMATAPAAPLARYADARRLLERAMALRHDQAGVVAETLGAFERLRRAAGGAEPEPPDPTQLAYLVDALATLVARGGIRHLLLPDKALPELDRAFARGGAQELAREVFESANLVEPEVEVVEAPDGMCAPAVRPEGLRLVIGAAIARDPPALQAGVLEAAAHAWLSATGVGRFVSGDSLGPVMVYLGLGAPAARLALARGEGVKAADLAALLAVKAVVRGDRHGTSAVAARLAPPLDASFEGALRLLLPDANGYRQWFGVTEYDLPVDPWRGELIGCPESVDGPGEPGQRLREETEEDKRLELALRPCSCGGNWQVLRRQLLSPDVDYVVDRWLVACRVCGTRRVVLFYAERRER